jgi:GntR family transcriptional regulator, transcriptional repressor for pyruvate dehydrogenase complex
MDDLGGGCHMVRKKAFDQVDRRRYSEQVIQMVVAEIMSNNLAVGDKLPGEKGLTEQFNVSRTVVREALRVLEESGLVEIRKGPKGGAFVTRSFHKPVSNSLKNLIAHGQITIDHLFDVRALIEPHVALQAARNATREDLEPLRILIDESLAHTDDVAMLKANNIRFHLLLSRAAGNPVLSILMESVIELVQEFSQGFSDLRLGRAYLRLHKQLLTLIEERRAEEAKQLISEEIGRVRDRLKESLSGSAVTPVRKKAKR